MSTQPDTVLHEALDTAKTVLAGLAIALALRVMVFQPFTIPSSSMEPGLVTGDYILVSKWTYGWSRASLPLNPPLPGANSSGGRLLGHAPRRGDVVVFRLPRDPSQTWIKRLVGLPGDRVQVTGGLVSVNGVALPQQALGPVEDHDAAGRIVPLVAETQGGRRYTLYGSAPDHEGANTGVYIVPAGHYFFMGDNRDNSLDGRWPRAVGVGFVPAENIVGEARMVLVSWREGASVLKPWTWLDIDWGRLLRPVR